MNKNRSIVALTAAALLFAACSSNSGSVATSSPTNDVLSTAATAQASSSPGTLTHGDPGVAGPGELKPNQPGVLVCTTGAGPSGQLAELDLLDPATGSMKETRSVNLEFDQTAVGTVTGGLCQSGWGLRSLEPLSSDYTKMSVASGPQPDGSVHIGYVTLSSGAFTDVTAETVSKDFNATVPIDSSPFFDPSSNTLFFQRGLDEIHKFNLSTGADQVVLKADQGLGSTQLVFTVLHGNAVVGINNAAVSPDGKLLASSGTGPSGDQPTVYVSTLGVASTANDGFTAAVSDGTPDADVYTVVGWSKPDGIVLSDQQDGSVKVFPPATKGTSVGRIVVEPNTKSVDNILVSPDGKTILFTTTVGTVKTSYTTSIPAPGAALTQPTKSNIDPGQTFLAWN